MNLFCVSAKDHPRLLGACIVTLACLVALGPSLAQDAPQSWGSAVAVDPTDAEAARTIIAEQLDALRREDGAGALAASAPSVRRRFPTPDAFMAMARAGYAPLLRSNAARFAAIRGAAATPTRSATWNQTVTIQTPDGQIWTAVYGLEREADGSLKIMSCVLVKESSGTA